MNKKLLDEEILREFYSGIVIRYYSVFEFWINERRVKSQTASIPYSNLEILYRRWSKTT